MSGTLRYVRGNRVRRGCDWGWVIETEPDNVEKFRHLDWPMEWKTKGSTTWNEPMAAGECILVRLPGKPDHIWHKKWIDQVDADPIRAGDRVGFVPCEAIRAHYNLRPRYNLPIPMMATVINNASGNELSHLMQVRLMDGSEGKFCFVQDVKSLIRREDIR